MSVFKECIHKNTTLAHCDLKLPQRKILKDVTKHYNKRFVCYFTLKTTITKHFFNKRLIDTVQQDFFR